MTDCKMATAMRCSFSVWLFLVVVQQISLSAKAKDSFDEFIAASNGPFSPTVSNPDYFPISKGQRYTESVNLGLTGSQNDGTLEGGFLEDKNDAAYYSEEEESDGEEETKYIESVPIGKKSSKYEGICVEDCADMFWGGQLTYCNKFGKKDCYSRDPVCKRNIDEAYAAFCWKYCEHNFPTPRNPKFQGPDACKLGCRDDVHQKCLKRSCSDILPRCRLQKYKCSYEFYEPFCGVKSTIL